MSNRRSRPLGLVLLVTAACILLPLVIIAVWSVVSRWGWPSVLPASFSLRGLAEVFAPHNKTLSLLGSSMALALAAALAATVLGLMTARACAFYEFRGKRLILFGSILPILVPGTVFAMGVHVLLIRMGLAGTVMGVLLVHTVCALPYTVNILGDVTAAVGNGLEEQAQVLGCPPTRAFFTVAVPQLLPGILSSLSMAYIISFSQYFLTLLIGGGRVKTFSVVMVPFISGGDRTLASAYALVFGASTVLMFAILEGLRRLAVGKNKEEKQ